MRLDRDCCLIYWVENNNFFLSVHKIIFMQTGQQVPAWLGGDSIVLCKISMLKPLINK